MHYIYPPRPNTSMPKNEAFKFYSQQNWIAQTKYNDTRICIHYNSQTIQIWNRHKQPIKIQESLITQLARLKKTLKINDWTVLDGGYLDQKHPAIKSTIVIWDILVFNNQSLIGSTYQERFNQLLVKAKNPHCFKSYQTGYHLDNDLIVPRNIESDHWASCWEQMDLVNRDYNSPVFEGFVFKNPVGVLEFGLREKNNQSWLGRCRFSTGRHQF